MAERNLAWDALVKATGANQRAEAGKIGVALKAIRESYLEDEGGMEPDLPAEITRRAQLYRDKWPHLTLTPTALAAHWIRVLPTDNPLDITKYLDG